MQQQSALICICQFWEQLLWDECLALSVRETLLLIPQPENNSPLSKELWGIKAGTAVLQQASTKDGPAELLPVCLEMETHPRARPSHGKHHLKFINISLNKLFPFISLAQPSSLPFPLTSAAASSPAFGSHTGLCLKPSDKWVNCALIGSTVTGDCTDRSPRSH